MNRDMEQVLDECIERLARGESIEACLSRHPEQREALLPLLEAAYKALCAANAATYRAEAKARGLYRLTQAAARGTPWRRRWSLQLWRWPVARPVGLALVAVLLLLGLGSIAAVASSDSVPGERLYWVKITRERLALLLPKSDEALAQDHARLAGERGREMRHLMRQGRVSEAERLFVRLEHHLARSAGYAGVSVAASRVEAPALPGGPHHRVDALRLILERDGQLVMAHRMSLPRHMPEQQKARAEKVLRRFEVSYRAFIAGLEEDPKMRSSPFWRTETVRLRDQ